MITDKSGLLEIFEKEFQSLEKGLNGDAHSLMNERRREAFKLLSEQGFPGRKHEEYKYTPLSKIIEKEIKSGHSNDQAVQSDLFEYLSRQPDIYLIVFKNGVLDKECSTLPEQEGLIINRISEVSDTQYKSFTEYYNKAIPGNNDSFALLNTSFSQDGIYFHLSKNIKVDKPVIILNSCDGERTRVLNPRNLFVFEEGSQATIAECFQTTGEWSVITNSFSEFFVKQNAHVKMDRLGFDGSNSVRVSTINVYQEKDSNFSSTTIDFGGKTIRNNLNIVVNGSGCESNMFGLYLINGTSHVDNHTMIDHKLPNCQSNELYKGIIADKARGVFNGKIYVRYDAQKTNAFQQNNNILLSDEATINTKPQLEIWADDVKCSHGCTTGQIDEEQVFYLRTRGIDEGLAKKMLLNAYASEILDSMELDVLKAFAEEQMIERLGEK